MKYKTKKCDGCGDIKKCRKWVEDEYTEKEKEIFWYCDWCYEGEQWAGEQI